MFVLVSIPDLKRKDDALNLLQRTSGVGSLYYSLEDLEFKGLMFIAKPYTEQRPSDLLELSEQLYPLVKAEKVNMARNFFESP